MKVSTGLGFMASGSVNVLSAQSLGFGDSGRLLLKSGDSSSGASVVHQVLFP